MRGTLCRSEHWRQWLDYGPVKMKNLNYTVSKQYKMLAVTTEKQIVLYVFKIVCACCVVGSYKFYTFSALIKYSAEKC